jgi:hypothetical protein
VVGTSGNVVGVVPVGGGGATPVAAEVFVPGKVVVEVVDAVDVVDDELDAVDDVVVLLVVLVVVADGVVVVVEEAVGIMGVVGEGSFFGESSTLQPAKNRAMPSAFQFKPLGRPGMGGLCGGGGMMSPHWPFGPVAGNTGPGNCLALLKAPLASTLLCE